MTKKPKATPNVQVVGRQVVYIQDVKKGGKLGKARPAVVTSVRTGGAVPTVKKVRRRKRK